MTDWSPTKLRDFFVHFDPSNPKHLKAADMLQQNAASIMKDDADWVRQYRDQLAGDDYLSPATDLIKKFEGFRANPYKCPAGVWTIGYGTTYYPTGELVQPWDYPISKAKADELLKNHVEKAIVPILAKTIPTWGVMNSNQKAAIISFAYNLGSHFYGHAGFNTITRALSKKENWGNVPSAMMLYVNPGSTFEAGLRRRREAEGTLWTKAT